MAKLVLGKSPEELEREKAEQERLRELEIQQHAEERQQKLQALYKTQKRNKFIIIGVFSAIVGIIFIFGVYNTFIKKNLTEVDAVNAVVNTYPGEILYPLDMLQEYLRDNSQALIETCMGTNKFTVDYDSVCVKKVRYISDTLGEVYFSADLVFDIPDTKVTSPYVISKIQEEGQSQGTSIVTLEENGIKTEYIKNGDDYYVKGGQVKHRYSFMLPLEYKPQEAEKEGEEANPISIFIPAGKLEFNNLDDGHTAEFDKIEVSKRYSFEDIDEMEDKETKQKIIDKVSKTLDDLYAHRDTSQDFLNYRKFDSQNATFDKVSDIKVYSQPNLAGYNVYAEYTIITEEGIKAQQCNYLLVEESGNSYVISAIL